MPILPPPGLRVFGAPGDHKNVNSNFRWYYGAGHFQFLDPAGFYRRPLFALAMRGISVCLLDRASGTRPASSPIAPSALSGLGFGRLGDVHSGNIWA